MHKQYTTVRYRYRAPKFLLASFCLTIFSLFLLPASIYAQVKEVKHPTSQKSTDLATLLGQLDVKQATSGYLLDKSMPFGQVGRYNGLPNVPVGDVKQFGLIYARLSGAATAPERTLGHYKDAVGLPKDKPGIVPIQMLAFSYHRLAPDALETGKVTLQGRQIVATQGQNPFEEGIVCLSVPWRSKPLKQRTCTFEIQPMFTNLTISSVECNLGDGKGWQPIVVGQKITTTYTSDGIKPILTRFRLGNGQYLHNKGEITIKASLLEDRNYGNSFTLDIPGATVTVLPACDQPPSIAKPFILVEGFNGSIVGDENFEGFTDKLLFTGNNTPTLNSLYRELEMEKVDIIYIDFDDGTLSLHDNTEIVKAVIREVNIRKHQSGSVEPTIVMGQSMGGIIAKMALVEMEDAYEKHECSKLYTYDSPLRGVNIPLGYQYFVNYLAGLNVGGGNDLVDIVPPLADAINELNSPAATEMTVYHSSYFPNKAPQYVGLYEHLSSLGAPQDCEHIAISNGSQLGNSQGFGPNAPLLDVEFDVSSVTNACLTSNTNGIPSIIISSISEIVDVTLGLFGNDVEAIFKVNALPSPAQGMKQVFHGEVYLSILFLQIFDEDPLTISVSGTQALDNAPGGYTSIPAIPACNGIFSPDQPQVCFVPTISALEIGPFNGTNPEIDPFLDVSNNAAVLAAGLTPINRYVAWDTPISTGTPSSSFNQFHLDFSDDISAVWLYDLRNAMRPVSPLHNRTYNFGNSITNLYNYSATAPDPFPYKQTDKFISGNFTIIASGKLWVNRGGKIGYTDVANNPSVLPNAHFDVHLGGERICPATSGSTVKVVDGGIIEIGDPTMTTNNTGALHVEANTSLLIEQGGTVIVNAMSGLNISANGLCHVKTGGKLIVKGQNGKVWVKPGGKLIIEPGATIELQDYNTMLYNEGNLVVNGDFKFVGSGYFDFAASTINLVWAVVITLLT